MPPSGEQLKQKLDEAVKRGWLRERVAERIYDVVRHQPQQEGRKMLASKLTRPQLEELGLLRQGQRSRLGLLVLLLLLLIAAAGGTVYLTGYLVDQREARAERHLQQGEFDKAWLAARPSPLFTLRTQRLADMRVRVAQIHLRAEQQRLVQADRGAFDLPALDKARQAFRARLKEVGATDAFDKQCAAELAEAKSLVRAAHCAHLLDPEAAERDALIGRIAADLKDGGMVSAAAVPWMTTSPSGVEPSTVARLLVERGVELQPADEHLARTLRNFGFVPLRAPATIARHTLSTEAKHHRGKEALMGKHGRLRPGQVPTVFLILYEVHSEVTATIRLRGEENKVVFSVKSTGHGLPPNEGWMFGVPSEKTIQARIERRAKFDAHRQLQPAMAAGLEKRWRWKP